MKITKVGRKYLVIFFMGMLLPYALVFGLLKYYNPDGIFITLWILTLPIAFPIWLKRLQKAKIKEAADNSNIK